MLLESTATARGWVKVAAVPCPLALPGSVPPRPPPARVLTVAVRGLNKRIKLLLVSAMKSTPLLLMLMP